MSSKAEIDQMSAKNMDRARSFQKIGNQMLEKNSFIILHHAKKRFFGMFFKKFQC